MIFEIPDVLTPVQYRQCREALERASWRDGRETAGHVAAQAKSNQQLAPDDPLTVKLGGLILDNLSRNEQFSAAAFPLKVLPPLFNRYAGGGAYGDHIDNAVFALPGTPHRIRSDLSATLFFSEPDEYEGGELVVRDGENDRRFKLAAGHMILYPANTLHHVTPVTKGARLAAFFWIQSLVREEARRSILIELGQSINALRQRLPGDETIERLILVQQNLLRQWAQV